MCWPWAQVRAHTHTQVITTHTHIQYTMSLWRLGRTRVHSMTCEVKVMRVKKKGGGGGEGGRKGRDGEGTTWSASWSRSKVWSGLETTIWTGRGASGDDTSAYEERDMLAVALSTESAWDIESHQKWIPECVCPDKNYLFSFYCISRSKWFMGGFWACCKIMKIVKIYFEFTHTHTHTPALTSNSRRLHRATAVSVPELFHAAVGTHYAENCKLKQIKVKIRCMRAGCLCHVTTVYSESSSRNSETRVCVTSTWTRKAWLFLNCDITNPRHLCHLLHSLQRMSESYGKHGNSRIHRLAKNWRAY